MGKAQPSFVPRQEETGTDFLPDFCSPRVVFAVVLVAQLLAFIFALAAGASRLEPLIQLALISLFVQWIALGNVVVLCLARRWLQALDAVAAGLVAYVCSLLVTLVFSLLTLWLVPIEFAPAYGYSGEQYFMLRNMAISAVLSAVALRYCYIQHQWKHNLEAESHARIQALQARIRPHFLFNSMNTIASLTRTSPEAAEKAVEDLADLFRISLKGQDTVRLGEELEFTRRYIDIEQLRLGERLRVEWHLDDGLPLDLKVPALMLQPLVENAIYHGIETYTGGGIVNVSISREKNRLRFTVENPKLKMHNPTRRPGNRMAQENIRQRLELAYGETGRMFIDESEDRYSVYFFVPLESVS